MIYCRDSYLRNSTEPFHAATRTWYRFYSEILADILNGDPGRKHTAEPDFGIPALVPSRQNADRATEDVDRRQRV